MRLRAAPIFLAFFVMGFVDVVGTLVGFARREFAVSGAEAGLLPFFGFVAFALFSVPAGVVAARRGKRWLLAASLLLVLAGQLVATFFLARFATLLVALFLIGVGMAALQVAGNPIMRDVAPPGLYARNLTLAQFVKSLGSIAGPYATAALVALGLAWTRVFPLFAAVTLATLLAVLPLRVEETPAEGPASVSSSFALLREPWIAALVLGIFLYVGAEVGLNSWLATLLSRGFGMDLATRATRLGPGLFFVALAAGRLLGSAGLALLSPRAFLRITTATGLAGLLALLAGGPALAVAGVALCGLGFANVWPLVFAIAVERRPGRAGELSGLMCMAIFGGAVVPPVMGFIADHSSVRWSFLVPLAAFAYLALLAAVARDERTAAVAAAAV